MYNKVLKDITNRYKIIQGYKVNFVNGFDCYGVEIEDNAVNLGKVYFIVIYRMKK
jgi:isoleucyl-tRNA synthetase